MARLLVRRDVTFAIVIVLFAVQAAIRYGSHLDPAVSWYLYAGGRLLDGAAIYTDIVEINPPLGLWLCAAIVWGSQVIGVDATLFYKTFFLLLTGGSLALSAGFIAAATEVTAATRHLLVILIAGLMLFLPAAEFGQRDHAGIVLLTPWLLLRWNRLLDRKVVWGLAALVGVAAALGLWLKPHFVLVLIAIEVTMLFATRDARAVLRVETVTAVAFGIVYMAIVRLAWSSGLLSTIALYGTRAYIPVFGVPFEALVTQLILPFALALAAIASGGLLTEQLKSLRSLLFVAGATLLSVFILQAGYRYQAIPALHFLAFAAGLGVARVVAGEVRLRSAGQGLAAAGAAIAIVAVFAGVWSSQVAPYHGGRFEDAIVREAPDARTIFIASADISDTFPLITENRLVWASRFPSLWLSPYIATKLDEEGGPADDIARFALEATVSDLIEFEPDVVFIDEAAERPHYRAEPLDYLHFWGKDLRFLRFWRDYEKRGMAGDFGVYVRGATAPD